MHINIPKWVQLTWKIKPEKMQIKSVNFIAFFMFYAFKMNVLTFYGQQLNFTGANFPQNVNKFYHECKKKTSRKSIKFTDSVSIEFFSMYIADMYALIC